MDETGRLNWHTIQDNAYLGIHEMTVIGKALTEAFYGKAPRYSYFIGGSTGGRQGLMEAQRFPEDYDGIISGCPAINWQRFIPAILWPQVVMANAKNYISKAKLDAATAAAIAACDEADGVIDGVIDDPLRCGYDPKALVGTKAGDEVFTEADADVVRKIWEGPRAPDGSFLWYGLERGADLSALAGTSVPNGSALKGRPFSIPLESFQIFLLQDPQWDWTTLTPAGFELRFKQSVEQYGAVIGTDDPNLRSFRDRGGKLIIYHGLADQLIPAAGSIHYFKRLEKEMSGSDETAKFARLFLAPGVDHGFRGAGPTPVGLQEAIMQWVEEGSAGEVDRGETGCSGEGDSDAPDLSISEYREIQRNREHRQRGEFRDVAFHLSCSCSRAVARPSGQPSLLYRRDKDRCRFTQGRLSDRLAHVGQSAGPRGHKPASPIRLRALLGFPREVSS